MNNVQNARKNSLAAVAVKRLISRRFYLLKCAFQTSHAEMKCPNDGTLYVNNQPVMEDLKCDPSKGWQGRTKEKVLRRKEIERL